RTREHPEPSGQRRTDPQGDRRRPEPPRRRDLRPLRGVPRAGPPQGTPQGTALHPLLRRVRQETGQGQHMNPQANRSYRWLFWGLVAAGLVADQAVKYGVFAWMYDEAQASPALHAERNLIAGAFDLQVQFTRETFAEDSWLTPLQTW